MDYNEFEPEQSSWPVRFAFRHLECPLATDFVRRDRREILRVETDEQGQTTVVAQPWPRQEEAPELRFPAETVIIALGLRADRSLADALADRPDVYTIGDCVEPREVLDAVYEGFEVGRTV